MADAEIIPIGGKGAAGRGSRTSPSAAARALAPPTRRRTTAPTPIAVPRAARATPSRKPAASDRDATTATAAPDSAVGGAPRVAAGSTTSRPARKVKATRTRATTPPRPVPVDDRRRSKAPRAAGATAGKAPVVKTARAVKAVKAVKPPASEAPVVDVTVLDVPDPETPDPETSDPGTPDPETPDLEAPATWPGRLPLSGSVRDALGEREWEQRLAELMAFLRRRITGDYVVDEFGFDPEVTERFVHTALRPIAQRWFRIDVRGIENIPAEGGALVVSNHSGTLPIDGMMTSLVVHDRAGRSLRSLGADLVFKTPFVGELARKAGATLASNEDAERMLAAGELVGVWPEGFKGIGKPFSERYKLQRFGRGGFVSAALRVGVPIIPCSVVGAEEIYPLIGNIPTLARLIGVPYIPITPFFPWLGLLGLVPLPSKWLIEFGEPIRTDAFGDGASEDPMLVFNVTDQVRETIQQTLYSLLMQRRGVFS